MWNRVCSHNRNPTSVRDSSETASEVSTAQKPCMCGGVYWHKRGRNCLLLFLFIYFWWLCDLNWSVTAFSVRRPPHVFTCWCQRAAHTQLSLFLPERDWPRSGGGTTPENSHKATVTFKQATADEAEVTLKVKRLQKKKKKKKFAEVTLRFFSPSLLSPPTLNGFVTMLWIRGPACLHVEVEARLSGKSRFLLLWTVFLV